MNQSPVTKCGYCAEPAVRWIEWPATRGRTKGAMVCQSHLGDTSRLVVNEVLS